MTNDIVRKNETFRLFDKVGRASLTAGLQNSHSGNMAVLVSEGGNIPGETSAKRGKLKMAITSSGSQKGALTPDRICLTSLETTDSGHFKASSEADIHMGILRLPGVFASMHGHNKNAVILTMDDDPPPKENPRCPLLPIDPLGFYHLGRVPVDWFEVPSGSPEMAGLIPERLKEGPATIIQGHGGVTRGRNLVEALFYLSIMEHSAKVLMCARNFGADISSLQDELYPTGARYTRLCNGRFAPLSSEKTEEHFSGGNFFSRPQPFEYMEDERVDFPDEPDIVSTFLESGWRIFESGLSPFHTGSMSIRGADSILYLPKASLPRGLPGPMLELPLSYRGESGGEKDFDAVHRFIYNNSNFTAIIHAFVPEAEAATHFRYPGGEGPADRMVSIDAEGSFLYPQTPILDPTSSPEGLINCLNKYPGVIVRGGGVWAVGEHALSEALHHVSSISDMATYRMGAIMMGLDIEKMESDRASQW